MDNKTLNAMLKEYSRLPSMVTLDFEDHHMITYELASRVGKPWKKINDYLVTEIIEMGKCCANFGQDYYKQYAHLGDNMRRPLDDVQRYFWEEGKNMDKYPETVRDILVLIYLANNGNKRKVEFHRRYTERLFNCAAAFLKTFRNCVSIGHDSHLMEKLFTGQLCLNEETVEFIGMLMLGFLPCMDSEVKMGYIGRAEAMKGWCQHKGSDAIVFPVCSSLCNYAAKSPMCGFCNDHKTILSTQSDGQYIGYDATHIKKCVCNGVVDEVLSRDAFTNLQVSVKVNSQVYGICTNRGILDQDGHMETCKPTRVGIAYNYSSEKGSVEFPRHLDFDTFRNHIEYNNRKKNKKPVFLDSTMIEVVNGRNKGRWDRWLFHPARCYPKQVRFVEKKGKKVWRELLL
ncbi:MAG: hypothetical protein MJE68_29070 [Proteobacteria bacterium]|nr:hypothetical protein [Pseudomonadota bacterium]